MIDEQTKIAQILTMHPKAAEVFREYGLECQGCSGAKHESLRQGAINHGLDVEELMQKLNALLQE